MARKRSFERMPWEPSEVMAMQRMWEQGSPDEEIGFALKRTARAVACQRAKTGMIARTIARGKSLAEMTDGTLIRALQRRGYSVRKVAK